MSKFTWIIILIIIVVGIWIWYQQGVQVSEDGEVLPDDAMISEDEGDIQGMLPTPDLMTKEMDEEAEEAMMTMVYDYEGMLTDVSGGTSSGVAKVTFADGTYSVLATFENLPDPEGTDFYEGWVVRRGENMSVISTGRVDKVDGTYTNMYMSGQDLTDHDFYVLTIEPDDGDPAPAAHIVEGPIQKVR